jgi:hypothetical protein
MDDLNEEVYQPIDHLVPPLPAERCQQSVPNRVGMLTDFAGWLGRDPETIHAQQVRGERRADGRR